ncbi:DUF2304 domain-containing protein [Candidatus Uhrbacteria bacterium]|jgi:small membrane protein|nr:DUF2304 domain-containing protein [Candidatus Uhrbacteria bacterium]
MIFQIILVAFALFAIAHVFRQHRKQKVSVHWLVMWTILWLLVIGAAMAPQTTDILAQKLGVERGADLIVYSAVVILIYGMYRMYVRVGRVEREMTELVRKVAIDKADKPE